MSSTLFDFFGGGYTEQDAINEQAAIRVELAAVEKLQVRYPNPSVYVRSDARKAGVERYLTSVGTAGEFQVYAFDDAKIADAQAKLNQTPAQMVAEMAKRTEKSERW